MALSRAQLAAALVEYDNDDVHPSQRRNYRDSALFSFLRPNAGPSSPPQVPRPYDGPAASSSRSGRGVGSDGARRGARRSGDSREIRSWGAEHRANDIGPSRVGENEMEEEAVDDDIDVSRWDLPEHLVAKPTGRPGTSASNHTARSVPFPHSGHSNRVSADMKLQINRASHPVPRPERSPVQTRAVSIHLDHLDGSSDWPRPSLESSLTGPGEEGSRRRTISFDLTDSGPRRRTISENVLSISASSSPHKRLSGDGRPEYSKTQRSNSVMGVSVRSEEPALRGMVVSHPVMVPLPDSPLSAEGTARPGSVLSRGRGVSFDFDRQGPGSFTRAVDPPPSDRLAWRSGPLGTEGLAGLGADSGVFESDQLGIPEDEDKGENEDDGVPNPFALPAPHPEQASRFDPKFSRSELSLARPHSSLSAHPHLPSSTGTDSVSSRPRPGDADYSRVWADPVPKTGTGLRISQANLAALERFSALNPSSLPAGHSHDALIGEEEGFTPLPARVEYDTLPSPELFGKPLLAPKYKRRQPVADRHALMRPKNLVMPSSLAGSYQRPVERGLREGFELGEVPLPRDARSSILTLGVGAGAGRGVGGELGGGRDFGAALAEEYRLRAEEEEVDRLEAEAREARGREREKLPGKLYGTSLMDQLEARKQYLKNKQRVFTGDSRPAMMARQSQVSQLPPSQSMHLATSPSKRQSLRAPLLQFDPNEAEPSAGAAPNLPKSHSLHSGAQGGFDERDDYEAANISPEPNNDDLDGRPRMSKSKSVFGVDQIWEREMAKLKIMQESEAAHRAAEDEVRRAKEAAEAEEEARRKAKKGIWGKRDKGKGKARESVLDIPGSEGLYRGVSGGGADAWSDLGVPVRSRSRQGGSGSGGASDSVSPVKKLDELPPMLTYSPEKRDVGAPLGGRMPGEMEGRRRAASRADMGGWGDSDDEDEYRRARGGETAAQGKSKGKGGNESRHAKGKEEESDSDDEVPLSRLRSVQSSSTAPTHQAEESSDEEENIPLSRLAQPKPTHTPATANPIPRSVTLNSDLDGSLGLSVPALPPSISPRPPTVRPGEGDTGASANANANDDEDADADDDVPLAYRQSTLFPSSGGPAPTAVEPQQYGRNAQEREEIEDDLPLGYKHAAAAQRQVSSSVSALGPPSAWPGMGAVSQQHPMSSMPAVPSIYGLPQYPHMQLQFPVQGQGYAGYPPPMGMGMSPSMYFPSAFPGMGVGVGMPQGGLGMQTMPGIPSMQGWSHDPVVPPGQNIDSWRKGVRAPSTVGGESGR